MKNYDFYNGVASFYDDMIGFDASLKNRIEIFSKLFAGYNIETAADIGCGSGLDTIALASLGYKVTGFDLSEGMIELAAKNARKNKVKPEFKKISLDRLNRSEFNKYDLVVSLGNALANMNEAVLKKTLSNINSMLKSGGLAVIQILNYNKILKEKTTVIGAKIIEDNTIIRFYDYLPESISFNILQLNNKNPLISSLYKTEIYPYKKTELTQYFKEAGFLKMKAYGSLKLDKFDTEKSKDLIIAAVKK